MNNKKLTSLLYKQFDSKLSLDEERELAAALNNSAELQREFNQIKMLRESIHVSAKSNFHPFFAERVMQKIDNVRLVDNRSDALFDTLFVQFRKVAFTAIALIILIVSYNIGKGGKLTLSNALATPEVTIENLIDPTNTLGWSD